ncbi:hypothetical protein GFH48_05940 [Streptomyces fagopyri]|uniref:Uncharacterized protein n=1 Tax=Streptomyces fagopyri TaxID=2662397 RepID=A0A5Q0L7F6_9ACTN|nr:hypothetical protein [Streptomyces fagopyri]QFZ72871.1 hypothetical protein GFH48_05940 [Streptomyces fagopyri]
MNRQSRRATVPYLAGWLFADVLLVIVLVVLGGERTPHEGAFARGPSPTPTPTPSARRSPSPEPTATPAPRTRPGGLDPATRSITVHTDADALVAGSKAARADLEHQVTDGIERFRGRTAAFVMVFGTVHGAGGAVDSGRSDAYATAVARLLPRAEPAFFPPYSEKIIRGDHDSSGDISSGTARIELFFLLR